MRGGAGDTQQAHFASAGYDPLVHLWTSDGQCVATQPSHRQKVTFLSEVNMNTLFGRNTPMVLTAGAEGLTKLWDLRRLKVLNTP